MAVGWGVQTSRLLPLFSWLPHFSPFSIAKYLASLGNGPLFPPLPTLLEIPPPAFFASASHTPPAPIVPGSFPLSCCTEKQGGGGERVRGGGSEENEFFSPNPRAPKRACSQAIKRNRHQMSPCNISALQNKVGT